MRALAHPPSVAAPCAWPGLAVRQPGAVSGCSVNLRGASLRSLIDRVPGRDPLRTGCWSSGKNISRQSVRIHTSVLRTSACSGVQLARVGREDFHILAARERHRSGTGVELSSVLAVCVSARRVDWWRRLLRAFPAEDSEPGSVFGPITGDPDPMTLSLSRVVPVCNPDC